MHRQGVMTRLVLGCAIALFAQSCNSPTAPEDEPVPPGSWGGAHVSLTVTATGAHLEFDCASGNLAEPLTIDASGIFAVTGELVQDLVGPITNQNPERKAALYSGRIVGNTMTLTVTLIQSNTTAGSFTLTRNGEPQVNKCG